MLRSFPFIIAFSIVTSAFAFRTALKNDPPTTVVFYNVENLFDTIDTPDVQDEDFTPSGKLNWNTERYQKKMKDLSGVLAAASAPALPLAFGLCEIENRAVVEDLVSTDALKKGSYKVVHADSPDARGIDVAFAYDASRMKELHHEAIRVHFDFEPETRTRDILYVKTLFKKDTLHFFINHWPSRRSGQQESEARRLVPAHIVRHMSDSLMKIDPQARIIIMGDFNDYPNSASMTEVIKAVPGSGSGLTNLTYALHASGKGSYNYKGEWGMLDQFIVSEGLLKAKRGLAVSDSSAAIHEAENLIYVNPKNGDRSPSKTYGGDKYYGGFSDHLPIVLRLEQRRIK